MLRLRAHGDEFKVALAFSINPLRMLIDDFAIWEAGRDFTDAAKSYEEELLAKVPAERVRSEEHLARERSHWRRSNALRVEW
jgi:hypothetical protein